MVTRVKIAQKLHAKSVVAGIANSFMILPKIFTKIHRTITNEKRQIYVEYRKLELTIWP